MAKDAPAKQQDTTIAPTPAGTKPVNVVPLFRRRPVGEDEPEAKVGLAAVNGVAAAGTTAATSDLDLSGRPKIWFMIGGGNSGKTVEVRWLVGRMAEQGCQAILAALDPANRSLATWFEQVEQPPSSDGAQTARWLREFLSFIMTEKSHNAVLDFGGGDTSLAKLIDTAPDIAATLEGEGIAPVACYTLTPRLDDLAALETLETAGFRPKATLLLFNEGRVDSSISRDEAFARVARHTAVRNALTRGAVPIWMPRLEPEVMGEIEGKRLQFTQARDGQVPQGARFAPIGGLERAMVRRWLERMEQAHAAIPSWLL